jgi:hypothetical protein
MDSNQASEQDQLSMTKIHQADQIDDHWVIGITIFTRSIASDRVLKITRPILAVDPGKDTLRKNNISLTRRMEKSKGRVMSTCETQGCKHYLGHLFQKDTWCRIRIEKVFSGRMR